MNRIFPCVLGFLTQRPSTIAVASCGSAAKRRRRPNAEKSQPKERGQPCPQVSGDGKGLRGQGCPRSGNWFTFPTRYHFYFASRANSLRDPVGGEGAAFSASVATPFRRF